MTDYVYDMDLVVDPLNTANVVANGLVSIYDPADTAGVTLLALKDASGLPLPNPVRSNSHGFLPPRIATLPQTMWKSGSFTGYFNSYKGLRDEAVGAKVAAQSAANNAAAAVSTALAGAVSNAQAVSIPPATLVLAPASTSTTPYAGDDFNAAANTSLIGRSSPLGTPATWNVISGDWRINSGSVSPTTRTDGLLAVLATPALERYTALIEGTLNVAGAQKGAPSAVFRYLDPSNYWFFELDPTDAGGKLYLFECAAGSNVARARWDWPMVNGDVFTFRIDVDGRDLTVHVNGTEIYGWAASTADPHAIGIRHSGGGDLSVAPASFSDVRVIPLQAARYNWPRLDAAPSIECLTLGAPGSWEDTDINNPNVVWDPNGKRWVLYYSGFSGGVLIQGLGLAYAHQLTGPWVKDPANPVFGPAGTIENGGLVYDYTRKRWLHSYTVPGTPYTVGLNTSTDLHTWTPLTATGIPAGAQDTYLRVTADGSIQMYYGDANQFRRLTSIDGGATWTADSWLLTPPRTGFFGGSGEPTVYVPPGKEGAEMIVFYDLVEYASYSGTEKRVNYTALTTDAGATWHHKKVAGGSGGTNFDAYQVFDPFPVVAEGAFHMFHSAAKSAGGGVDMLTTLGRRSVQWDVYRTDAHPVPYQ